jgi:osmotically-inducible protein OsmY
MILLALAAVLVLAGCSDTRRQTTTMQGGAEREVTGSDLERSIEARLTSDRDLAVADIDVNVDADHNMATLSGKVVSQNLRERAVALAKQDHPGMIIKDEIDVDPEAKPRDNARGELSRDMRGAASSIGEASREVTRDRYTEDMAAQERTRAEGAGHKIGKSIDDAWIHSKITAKLLADTSAPTVNVDVENNVVTLRGEVKSAQEKTEVGRIARETDGVKSVNNRLVVKPGA